MNYTLYKILRGPKRFKRSTQYLLGVKTFVEDYENETTTDLFSGNYSKGFLAGYSGAQMRFMSRDINFESASLRAHEQAAGA